MSALRIYTSNRLESLAEHLAMTVRTPLSSPLAPEMIVVQSRGMQRWLSLELARHNGVSANCAFPFPNVFLDDIFKALIPNLPDPSPFDPGLMVFRIMKMLPDCIQRPGFEDLKVYLSDDPHPLKLFQFSVKMADLFDQYLLFRPDLILKWEKDEKDREHPYPWQKELWLELVRGNEGLHRARLQKMLFDKLAEPAIAAENLPQRVSIFGISYLPVYHLLCFARLSRAIEINFFLLNPSQEYWAGIVSDWEMRKIIRRYPQVAEPAAEFHLERGNRLLASMGSLGRDFFAFINEFDCETHELFENAFDHTLLGYIQSDILNLIDRQVPTGSDATPEANRDASMTPSPLEIKASDRSLQVHVCHSPMREIEVLHDNLLAMFEEDSMLLPKDIIVMTPDINAYAPYISAVFGAQTDETLHIPFSIADQGARRESRIIDAFLTLLELKGSRFGATQLIRLLEFPAIRKKFGLAESDMQTIEGWIHDVGIRWGIDERDRETLGLPSIHENTWRSGIERLLLGYAMPGGNLEMFDGILPYDDIEGGEVQILGRFLEFIDCIFSGIRSLDRPQELNEWQTTLHSILEQFIQPEEDTESEIQTLRQRLDELTHIQMFSGLDGKLELEVVRAHLDRNLEKQRFGSGFISGGVTFCAMLPMRSIPFQVVCLVGMNTDTFPRDSQPLTFDLMAKYPRPGDRSRRRDDKYLFLEALISARKKLYISYVGQSIQDNTVIPPSVLVSELLDTVQAGFFRSGHDILEQVVTKHRLQPFSQWYFKDQSKLFSYSTENLQASMRSNDATALQPFISKAIPIPPEEADQWKQIDIATIKLFFSSPIKFLLQRRLEIRLEEDVAFNVERENFELTPLQRYWIGQALVKTRMAGLNLQESFSIQKATGQLPHGRVGEVHFNEMSATADRFVKKIEVLTQGPPVGSIDVDLEISGLHLTDRLANIYRSGCVISRYAKRSPKDLLNSWIHHLLYCDLKPPGLPPSSLLICKDSVWEFRSVANSRKILQDLLELFRQGLSRPLYFFPKSSFEYAFQRHGREKSPEYALHRAQIIWFGNDFASGESEDPYYQLCLGHIDSLDETFETLAVRIYQPLLEHGGEIKL